MSLAPKSIDDYIAQKRPAWQTEFLKQLRELVHEAEAEIKEDIKWGAPYFMYQGKAVAWMFCAKEWVHFSFLQGALLQDWEKLFVPTDNKAARTIKFREGDKLPHHAIIELAKEAVKNIKEGKKVDFKRPKPGSQEFDLPREYEQWLKRVGELENYLDRPFYQQRGWIEWIEQAKTEDTKIKRMNMMLIELRHGQYMPNAADRYKE